MNNACLILMRLSIQGGDCNEGLKARPNIDVTMKVRGKVIQPDGNGVVFLDKPSLEIRFGEPNPIRFVSGGSIISLKWQSYEIDFENVDENWQILALIRAAAVFWIFRRHLWLHTTLYIRITGIYDQDNKSILIIESLVRPFWEVT